jgi:hypothetical protein
MPIPEATLWGGLIGVVGTIAGILVGTVVNAFQAWLKEKREVRRLATILHQELFDQGQAVALSANFANHYNRIVLDPKRPRKDLGLKAICLLIQLFIGRWQVSFIVLAVQQVL